MKPEVKAELDFVDAWFEETAKKIKSDAIKDLLEENKRLKKELATYRQILSEVHRESEETLTRIIRLVQRKHD